jgi:hypothetical protein
MATNNAFMERVADKYSEIKKTFTINAQALKMEFNEDIFHDTLLKCSVTYRDDVNDFKKIKAYLWVSYKINVLNKMQRTKRMENIDELEGFDIIDEVYNPEIDELFEIVRTELYDKFGEFITDVWFEHIILEKEYDEIEEEYGIKNIHYQFKKIRKYIRTEIPKKNKKFIEIVHNLDRKL